jgi:preprotein translocase subunit SecA
LILDMIHEQVDRYLDQFLDRDYGVESFSQWAGKELAVELESKDFRGMDFEAAERYLRDQAERMIEGQVLELLDENLPDDVDMQEWNWEALAKAVNTRWRLNLRERDLRQVGRDALGEYLIERARKTADEVDLKPGQRFLDPGFGVQTTCAWVRKKFGIELASDEVGRLEPEAFKDMVNQRAEAAYHEKEVEYPVMAGLLHFTARDAAGHKRYDREGVVAWAPQRFQTNLDLEDLKNKQREEIRGLLIETSRQFIAGLPDAQQEADTRLAELLAGDDSHERAMRAARDDGRLKAFCDWLAARFGYVLTPEEAMALRPKELENQVAAAVEGCYRPEMRKMERVLVLQLLDTAWKDHLLVMDHLRNSVGLRGYAQVDPKVEYKKEGMRTFEAMWSSVGERVTDLVFRMEQMDESFVGSTWSGGEARHDSASATDIAQQQQAAIDGTQVDHKPEPIRNRQQRVGRNDPCPCGSGKKFKNCHMRKGP